MLSYDKRRITAEARAAYAKAYATDAALTAGFNWYRTLYQDAAENRQAAAGSPGDTPLLYLRGAHETGDIDEYVHGLQAAGVTRVDHALVPDAGHFTQEEASEQTWHLISRFAGLESGRPGRLIPAAAVPQPGSPLPDAWAGWGAIGVHGHAVDHLRAGAGAGHLTPLGGAVASADHRGRDSATS